jgi:hypothetical protein
MVIGLRFFAFSASGNTTIKTYLQTSLKEEFNMPVKVYNFSLDEDKMEFSVHVNEQIQIDVETQYNMLTQYFAGIYYFRVKDFEHKGLYLRDANLSGRFKGRRGNMQIQGQGTVFHTNIVYRFHLKKSNFRHIEAKIKGLNTADVLSIIGEKPLFVGNIDLDINLPKLGEDTAKGYANIIVHKSLFDTQLMEDKYTLSIPKNSHILADLSMTLEGTKLDFSSKLRSNLFSLDVTSSVIDVEEKSLKASYDLDMKHLELFSNNTLSNAFKVNGNILADKEQYILSGKSTSWGGFLGFEFSEKSSVRLHNIHLDKLLLALKQVPYAQGLVTANINHQNDLKKGTYALNISEGLFLAEVIDENFGYQIPSINSFNLISDGILLKENIRLKANLKSSLGDMILKDGDYNIHEKNLYTNYEVFLPNVGLLLRNNRAVKRGYISAVGKATLGNDFMLKAEVKGLGGTVEFIYDKNTAKVEASELFVEKVLSLASVSRYIRGKIQTNIVFSDVKKRDANFSFISDKIFTQPRMIEKLIGKKIAIAMRLKSEGQIKENNITVSTYLDSKIARLHMDDMQINTTTNHVKSSYVLDIPELKNAYALTGKKLYGPIKFLGNIVHDKVLSLEGVTHSLGGEISYQYLDTNMTAKIKKVSLENILLLFGHDTWLNGEVSGSIDYDFKETQGELEIKIDNFHLNENSITSKLKLLISKDPTSIIYEDTRVDAVIEDDITNYTFKAVGLDSSLEIKEGVLDKSTDTHTGIFTFMYKEYEIIGNITGTITDPKLSLDPSAIMGKKIQKELNHALGDKVGEVVGSLLKDLKL